MASICRLCATLRKIESFINIHDTTLDLCTKLEKCCQLVVPRTNDALPQNVCNECVLNLNDCWKFFQKVHESQESLSKIFYISEDQNNSSEEFYSQGGGVSVTKNATHDNNSSTTLHEHEKDITNHSNSNQVKNGEVERLLHNITIINENGRNLIVNENSDDDSENDLKIEMSDQLNFEGLDDTDFAIAAQSIIDDDNDNHNNIVITNCSTNSNVNELHSLQNIHQEAVDNRVQTETTKYVDQTIDQIEIQLEDEEFNQEEIENANNENVAINSATFLSSSDARSMLIENLDDELELLGSWQDYLWKCFNCTDFIGQSAFALRDHTVTDHIGLPVKYVCTDCLKIFDKYYAFVNHVKSRHRTQLQLCCDICSEFFDSSNSLAHHRNSNHIDEMTVEINRFGKPKLSEHDLVYCPVCAKAFKNNNALIVHTKGHQPLDIKYKFSCEICERVFATRANLKAHHKIHTGLKEFICTLCAKGFVQKANLDEHMLTHTQDTPYECEECNRKFKTSDRLAKHKAVHSDVRPHKCTICGNTFREKDTLRVHSRIHTGEMPYACDFCGKRFRFRSVLTTHRHQHTGERPYSCVDCNHFFTNWPNYNKHMKRRHGINTKLRNGQTNSNVNTTEENATTIIIPALDTLPSLTTTNTI